jgi:hypothetical protein
MRNILLFVVALAGTGTGLSAQCETSWQPQVGSQSVLGTIKAFARWDPDGAGPQPEQVVVGGLFSAAGGLPLPNLAMFEPLSQTFSILGGSPDGEVLAIEPLPNGDLAVAGAFTQIGGVTAAGIAIWNGSNWTGLPGASGTVMALGTDASGRLVAGGQFASIGGVSALNVAVWDGTNWNPLGNGLPSGNSFPASPGVHDFALLPNGEIVAAGVLTAQVATWNGATWTSLPTPPGLVLHVTELAVEASGTLICGGWILSSSAVLRWNGTSWTTLGNLDSEVTDVELLPNGDVIACGNANNAGVFRWNGTTWATLGAISIFGGGRVEALQEFTVSQPGQFFVGGSISTLGTATGSGLFQWNGSAFLGDVVSANGIRKLTSFPDGDVYATGHFTQINGVTANGIARWGQNWQAAGTGLPSTASAVARLADGDLVAATQQGVYRLNGTTWTQMPGSPSQAIEAMLLRPNGELLVGGNALWRFDGTAWAQISGISQVVDMESLPNGDVVLSGISSFSFPISGGRIAVWDGNTTWTALDPNFSVFNPGDVVVLPHGDIAVADTGQNGVRAFDGTTWSTLGALNGIVRSLQKNSAGQLFAGGSFTADGATPCNYIAHWDGLAWSPVAGGAPQVAWMIAPAASGDMLAVLSPSPFAGQTLAAHRTACPATAQTYSPTCAGASTTSELAVTSLPLVGADYSARATGLSGNAIVFDLYGLQAVNLPLPSLFQIGQPGCVLAVDPIEVRMVSAQATMHSTFAIPAQPAVIGFGLRHQMLVFDVGPQNNLLAASTTNALEITVGSSL